MFHLRTVSLHKAQLMRCTRSRTKTNRTSLLANIFPREKTKWPRSPPTLRPSKAACAALTNQTCSLKTFPPRSKKRRLPVCSRKLAPSFQLNCVRANTLTHRQHTDNTSFFTEILNAQREPFSASISQLPSAPVPYRFNSGCPPRSCTRSASSAASTRCSSTS